MAPFALSQQERVGEGSSSAHTPASQSTSAVHAFYRCRAAKLQGTLAASVSRTDAYPPTDAPPSRARAKSRSCARWPATEMTRLARVTRKGGHWPADGVGLFVRVRARCLLLGRARGFQGNALMMRELQAALFALFSSLLAERGEVCAAPRAPGRVARGGNRASQPAAIHARAIQPRATSSGEPSTGVLRNGLGSRRAREISQQVPSHIHTAHASHHTVILGEGEQFSHGRIHLLYGWHLMPHVCASCHCRRRPRNGEQWGPARANCNALGPAHERSSRSAQFTGNGPGANRRGNATQTHAFGVVCAERAAAGWG